MLTPTIPRQPLLSWRAHKPRSLSLKPLSRSCAVRWLVWRTESSSLKAYTGHQSPRKCRENSCVHRIPEVHYQLGALALKHGRNTEALQDLEQAARLDPHSMKVHFTLSRVNRRLGRTEEASRQMDLYQRLKEAEPQPAATPSQAGASQN